MRLIKIFKTLEYGLAELEAQINAWIEQNNIQVIDVKVQLSPQTASTAEPLGESNQSDLLILVIYEKK